MPNRDEVNDLTLGDKADDKPRQLSAGRVQYLATFYRGRLDELNALMSQNCSDADHIERFVRFQVNVRRELFASLDDIVLTLEELNRLQSDDAMRERHPIIYTNRPLTDNQGSVNELRSRLRNEGRHLKFGPELHMYVSTTPESVLTVENEHSVAQGPTRVSPTSPNVRYLDHDIRLPQACNGSRSFSPGPIDVNIFEDVEPHTISLDSQRMMQSVGRKRILCSACRDHPEQRMDR